MPFALNSASLYAPDSVRLSLNEIIAALSFALDLTEGAVPGHAVRSCLLSMRLGRAMGLDEADLSDLYYAALLKDVGCSSNSARFCQIVGGDDVASKASAKLMDWTQPHKPDMETAKAMWKHVLPGANPLKKTARIVHMAATQHANNKELISLRCDRGASIVRKIGLNDAVADAVRHLDEHWDGSGYPSRLIGTMIPLLSRLILLAQHLDVFCMEKGPEKAIEVMLERSGRWFEPALTEIAMGLHRAGMLWERCMPGGDVSIAHAAVLEMEPGDPTDLTPFDIDMICEAFADVVDAKSAFTFRHSMGVKNAAVSIGRAMGMSGERLQMLRRAALLHDVGKLGVPNSILDKNGKLTDEEFLIVKKHPGMSQQILSKVGAFREIAAIAGEHHERLDRSGYPHRLCKEDMSMESRILGVADVYGALSEDRPYRGGLELTEIASIMERDIPGRLDADCYEALRAAIAGPGVKDAGAGGGFEESLMSRISDRALAVMQPVDSGFLACGTAGLEVVGA